MDEEEISFSYVDNMLIPTGNGQVWVRIFALSSDKEHIELVKKQIEKGNEAMSVVNRLKNYYEKEEELCQNQNQV
ncbi:hypothetical protein LCGC14_0345750 [marine sediment metagenome]|uniref:Uncharacterized protein n=1 Tax=marine sediment metagenome TaxID=412755 RepID=A0A0F9WK18_9ZZZZ